MGTPSLALNGESGVLLAARAAGDNSLVGRAFLPSASGPDCCAALVPGNWSAVVDRAELIVSASGELFGLSVPGTDVGLAGPESPPMLLGKGLGLPVLGAPLSVVALIIAERLSGVRGVCRSALD